MALSVWKVSNWRGLIAIRPGSIELTEVYTVVGTVASVHERNAPIVSALVLAERASDLIKERHTVIITVKLVGSVWVVAKREKVVREEVVRRVHLRISFENFL